MKPGSLLQSKVPNPASKSKDEERRFQRSVLAAERFFFPHK